MLKKFVNLVGGDPNKREIENFSSIIDQINDLETSYEKLDDQALNNKSSEFRERLAEGIQLDDILIEAFAAVREASK